MSNRLQKRLAHQNTAQKTGNPVFSRTSSRCLPPQAPTFAAVKRQFVPVAPPLADLRRWPLEGFAEVFASHSPLATRHCTFLIYGTGIKKLRKPTPIDEYKLLIYGKPPVATSNWHPGARFSRDTGTPITTSDSNSAARVVEIPCARILIACDDGFADNAKLFKEIGRDGRKEANWHSDGWW